jgi:hypothetical protein
LVLVILSYWKLHRQRPAVGSAPIPSSDVSVPANLF